MLADVVDKHVGVHIGIGLQHRAQPGSVRAGPGGIFVREHIAGNSARKAAAFCALSAPMSRWLLSAELISPLKVSIADASVAVTTRRRPASGMTSAVRRELRSAIFNQWSPNPVQRRMRRPKFGRARTGRVTLPPAKRHPLERRFRASGAVRRK